MKAWVSTLIVATLLSACILHKKPEQSESYAITDGRLALGAVPSISDGGMQAYRLLLCKNTGSYNEQDFSDPTKCRAALIDSRGRDVVLQSEALLRPFGEKISGAFNVATGMAGVTLIGVGVFGLYKWFIKVLGKGMKNTNQISKPDTSVIDQLTKVLHYTDTKKNKELIAKLGELKDIVKEGDRNKIAETIRKIGDKSVEAWMRSEYSSYDAETVKKIREIADEIKAIDKKFAAQVEKVADGNIYTLGADGVQFYEERLLAWSDNFRKQFTQVSEPLEVRQLNKFIKNNSKKLGKLDGMKVDDLKKGDRQLYAKFVELRKKLADSKAIKNFRKSMGIEDNVSIEKALLDIYISSPASAENYPTVRALRWAELRRNAVRNAILDSKANKDLNKVVQGAQKGLGNLDVSILSLVKNNEEIKQYLINNLEVNTNTKISDVTEVMQKIFGDPLEMIRTVRRREAVTENNGIITIIQKLLDEPPYIPPNIPDKNIMDGLTDIIRTERNRLNTIETLKARVYAYKIDPANLAKELEKLDNAHAQRTIDLMGENKNMMEDAVEDAVEAVDQDKRKWWGLGGLSAATAGAVMVSLNNSIWGNGEKQLGKHWSQIFSNSSDFADASTARDLPAILTKLAQVLGHNVNGKALALDGEF